MKDAAKNASLKMYHVMSVKQTLREDLAEHAYQEPESLEMMMALCGAISPSIFSTA